MKLLGNIGDRGTVLQQLTELFAGNGMLGYVGKGACGRQADSASRADFGKSLKGKAAVTAATASSKTHGAIPRGAYFIDRGKWRDMIATSEERKQYLRGRFSKTMIRWIEHLLPAQRKSAMDIMRTDDANAQHLFLMQRD